MFKKKTYLKPLSKVSAFSTHYATMLDGYPRGSYSVNELEPEDPVIIGGDDDANAAPFMKNLWDFEE